MQQHPTSCALSFSGGKDSTLALDRAIRRGWPVTYLLNLYDAAKLIDQPFLSITGRNDRLIPWEQSQRQAEEARGGEFVLYDDGNHVCNNIPWKYRPLTADWLKEKLAL